MKRILAAVTLAALLSVPFARAATVGGYPNATTPLNGTERILADQTSGSYPCVSCTVNITPSMLASYTASLTAAFSILYNNNGVIGGLIPSATGQYCLDWTNLAAAPALVTCTSGSSAFSALTSGTNTTAAMVVGSGATLSATGTGTIGATSAPLTGITGLGTGVGTALGVNVGSAGAFVVNGGALGTPSSGVGTNITGVNAASVGGFTLPCTVPTLVSGGYLTNNGTTCSWAPVSGGSFPSGTTNQLLYYASSGTTVTPLTLGTNLSITGGTLNAAGAGFANPSVNGDYVVNWNGTAQSLALLDFSMIGSAVNTNALTVGSGGSLDYSGTGTIDANKIDGGVVPTSTEYTYNDTAGRPQPGTFSGCLSSGSPSNQAYNLAAVFTETGSTYTVGTNSDDCALELANNSSGITFYLPPAGYYSNYRTDIQQIANSGTVTVQALQIGNASAVTATDVAGGGNFAAGSYYCAVGGVDAAGETTGVISGATATLAANDSLQCSWTNGANSGYVSEWKIYYSTSAITPGTTTANYCVAPNTVAGTYTITATCATAEIVPGSNTTQSPINGSTSALTFSGQWESASLWEDSAGGWHATGIAGTTAPSYIGWASGNVPQATTGYLAPGQVTYANLSSTSGVDTPVASTITGFNVAVVTSPASGQTFTFTLYKNGAATTLTCQIANPNKTCASSGSISLSVGDIWNIQVVTSATSSSTGLISSGVAYMVQ